MHLFVVSLVVVRVVNIEITKLVRGFRWGNYVQVVTKLLLLQVFLCEIFQKPFSWSYIEGFSIISIVELPGL